MDKEKREAAILHLRKAAEGIDTEHTGWIRSVDVAEDGRSFEIVGQWSAVEATFEFQVDDAAAFDEAYFARRIKFATIGLGNKDKFGTEVRSLAPNDGGYFTRRIESAEIGPDSKDKFGTEFKPSPWLAHEGADIGMVEIVRTRNRAASIELTAEQQRECRTKLEMVAQHLDARYPLWKIGYGRHTDGTFFIDIAGVQSVRFFPADVLRDDFSAELVLGMRCVVEGKMYSKFQHRLDEVYVFGIGGAR